jgi:alkylhydroperoxidase/carboxymuconolactone decarboxylase family protein YurZ
MTNWFNKLPKRTRAIILIAALVAIGFFWYMAWQTATNG